MPAVATLPPPQPGQRADEPHGHPGIAQSICAGVLAVYPAGARLIVNALDRYAKVERIRLSPQAQELRDKALRTALHAESGHPDVPSGGGATGWPADQIGTQEAAKLIGCSARHVRRLAADGRLGSAPVHRGRLLLSRAEVLAFTEDTDNRTRQRREQ